MNFIIINGNNFYVDKSNDQLIVFIDCKFNSKIYFKLVELSKELKLYIFVKHTNRYTMQQLKDEREAIITNPTKAIVDNYYRYQLDNLITSDNQVSSSIPTERHHLEQLVNNQYLLEQPIEKNFITEYKIDCNQLLKAYIELLFRNLNADKIAITADTEKINKLSSNLSNADKLIAISSNNVDDQIFFIADNILFKQSPKLVIIGQADYKYAVNKLLLKDYIIDFNDSLRYSKYFKQLCTEYGVQTTNQYSKQTTIINDSFTITAIFDLVDNYGSIEIYQIKEQEQVLINKFTSQDLIYKRLKAEFNHCLKVNIQWTIEQSILKQQ